MHSSWQGSFAHRQPVSVGCNATQGVLAQIKQQTVQVVPNILLSHGESCAFDQLLQRCLRDAHSFNELNIIDCWKLIWRQRGQGKPASSSLHCDFVISLGQCDSAAVRQSPDDLKNFSRWNRCFALACLIYTGSRDHFNFKIRSGQRQLPTFHHSKQVGEHRERVPTLNDVYDLLQWLEQNFAR